MLAEYGDEHPCGARHRYVAPYKQQETEDVLPQQAAADPTPGVSCGDHVVLTPIVFKAISVLSMEQTDPVRLLAQVFRNAVIFLDEDPDRLLCTAARGS